MLKIIPGATGYFNKTLNSNNIYGKSIDYAALRHRDIIIAKIDLFIQRITHNLWHARKKMCF